MRSRSVHASSLLRAVAVLAGVVAVAAAPGARGAGFELLHQDEALLGTAFAGTAAVADNGSTAFYNPAGLPLVGLSGRPGDRNRDASGWRFAAGAAVIFPTNRFSNTATLPAPGAPLGSEGGNTGSASPLPVFNVAYHSRDDWGVGFAVGVPYGLKSEYSADWMGRYIAVNSELITWQANLAAGFKVAEHWWLGAGVSYLSANSKLTNAVNWGPFGDGQATVDTSDSAWGYNLGVMWQPAPATRVGFAYRSGYKLHLTGSIDTTFPGSPAQLAALGPIAQAAFAAANGGATASGLNLPASATLSLKQTVADRWDVLVDVARVRWSSFERFEIARDNGLVLTAAPQNWDDTWRIAIGTAYRVNEAVTVTAGVAYDQTPVPNQFRNPIVPDNDWRWFALGTQIALNRSTRLDLSYAYISVKKAGIDSSRYDAAGNPDPNSGTLVGNYNTYSHTIGVQVVWTPGL